MAPHVTDRQTATLRSSQYHNTDEMYFSKTFCGKNIMLSMSVDICRLEFNCFPFGHNKMVVCPILLKVNTRGSIVNFFSDRSSCNFGQRYRECDRSVQVPTCPHQLSILASASFKRPKRPSNNSRPLNRVS
jgi:hypothetical protein